MECRCISLSSQTSESWQKKDYNKAAAWLERDTVWQPSKISKIQKCGTTTWPKSHTMAWALHGVFWISKLCLWDFNVRYNIVSTVSSADRLNIKVLLFYCVIYQLQWILLGVIFSLFLCKIIWLMIKHSEI